MLRLKRKWLIALTTMVPCFILTTIRGAQPTQESFLQNNPLTNSIEYQRWRWAVSQRASPRGRIPEDAQLRTLDQIKQQEMPRQVHGPRLNDVTALAPIQGERWVNIGPAP